jgi:hypothetical protein
MKLISSIHIFSNESAHEQIDKILSKVNLNDKKSLVENFYQCPCDNREWSRKNIGSQWIYLQNVNLEICSCDFVPIKFICQIYNKIHEIDSNCIIEVRFRHESNEPVGAMLLKENKWVINDYDFDSNIDDVIIACKIEDLMKMCYVEIETDPNTISYHE